MPDRPDFRTTLEVPLFSCGASSQAITDWFVARHGRLPYDVELGAIMLRIAQSTSTPPIEGEPDPGEAWAT